MKNVWIRALALLLGLCMMGAMLAGCGVPGDEDEAHGDTSDDGASDLLPGLPPASGDTEQTTVKLEDFDPAKTYPLVDYFALDMTKYVQLGRYKNMSVTIKQTDITVADATVQNTIHATLAEHHPDARITDRPVQTGDTIVMDYVGKLNGVAFGGGTALEQTITISENNGYIPGFVDGMIGLIPGEMTEVPVTFPADYNNEQLKGKDVIFEMTVHYIVGSPELDDAFVVSYTNGEMTTAEEYTASVRAELEEQAYDSAVRTAIWTKIMENTAVKSYPADAVLYYYQYYYTLYSQYAAMYGLTYETFLTYSGTTAQALFDYCKSMVQQDLVRHAVYQDGGYTCTDEEYQALLDEYTEANYASLRSSMLAAGEGEYTKEQARAYFHSNYSSQLKDTCLDGIATTALRENATVTVE